MCGFAGVLNSSDRRHDERCRSVQAMIEALRHRGPDDAGVWADQQAGITLGFRRLAILDLSEAGHQPMVSRNGQFVMVFNGEIYNHADLKARLERDAGAHPWAGHSDTEILLACCAAWGPRRMLEATVGMFALALWDRRDGRLYLARDRFGEKPLYYGWTRNAFLFGSELKAFRRYPEFDNPIDRDVLALYLQYSAVPAPYSIYRNIYKLQPGCLLSMTGSEAATPPEEPLFAPARHGSLVVERYWSLTDVVERGQAELLHDEHEATEQLDAALSTAVRLQSIADVPLGAFLSGGIDSTAIVALMQAQSTRQVKTFTVGFDERGFNEAVHAKAVARHLGTDHTELYLSAQQALDVIPKLPDLYSEPFADSSQIPTHLVATMARQHVTVALSGDGGDELFGGYTRYVWAPRIWKPLGRIPSHLRRGLGAYIRRLPVSRWDAIGAALPASARIARLGDKAHKLAHRLTRVNDIHDLYRTMVMTWQPDAQVAVNARPLRTLDLAVAGRTLADVEHRMMLWDALTYLPDDILHKVDRASMGVSLEARAPFLDHRVAELAWRMPVRLKIRGGQGKWVLRQLLDRYVPRELIERPKMGFGVPIDEWLRKPLRAWAEDLLSEPRLRAEGYLDPTPIRQKWAEHLSGTRNWHQELWSVLMFQAWLDCQR